MLSRQGRFFCCFRNKELVYLEDTLIGVVRRKAIDGIGLKDCGGGENVSLSSNNGSGKVFRRVSQGLIFV